MTASEFAFLALGLVLGVASGAALVMVLGAHPSAREVRLTVERDAVPRRAATLSSDAFVTAPAEPARGGPADRRYLDRDSPPEDPRPGLGSPAPLMASMASMAPGNRTTVSFDTRAPARGGIRIGPERDPAIDMLRVQAAVVAERLYGTRTPTATARLAVRVAPFARSVPAPARVESPGPAPEPTSDAAGTPALVRILRGDHRALFATTAALAGADAAQRRPWHAALLAFTAALADRAARSGWLDVPVGNPFWDSFTISQCREIAAALATTGHRFDGIDGWAEGRIPTYRDLTMAVAAAGLEPRRIRAWPTREEIAGLYREVTLATDDFVATHAPDMDLPEIQGLVGLGGPDLARLWASWDRVRTMLLEPIAAA